ncbi:hypothetical protein ES707_12822 [subsurface metagenome]
MKLPQMEKNYGKPISGREYPKYGVILLSYVFLAQTDISVKVSKLENDKK